MATKLESDFESAWPAAQWSDVTALAAVSGGPDSVALLQAMVRLQPPQASGRIVVAHYNHRWRGAASDGDEAFVKELAASLGLVCEIGQAHKPSFSEEAARDERYNFLLATAHRVGARFVAVGHTADDQAETILFRILRGTGPSGLTGMPKTRRLSDATTLVRPLLSTRRTTVLEYLDRLRQPYCTDASNRDLRFARNRLRHEVFPALQGFGTSDVVEGLVQLGRQAAEVLEPIRSESRRLLDQVLENQGDLALLHLDRLEDLPGRAVLREMFVELWRCRGWPRGEMSAERWERLAEAAITGECSENMMPGGVRVDLDARRMRIERPQRQ
jgi:tRNA(Ile)-lysidine synthase